MSRWLQRLSSKSAVDNRSSSKRQVHAHSIASDKITAQCHYTTLLSSYNDLTDREEELCRRSYQLIVWKLQLLERETSLTQVSYSSPI